MVIEKVHAREILDSRGNPTVEAEVWLADGTVRLFLLEHLPVRTKHSNVATVTRAVTAERAFRRLLTMSTTSSLPRSKVIACSISVLST